MSLAQALEEQGYFPQEDGTAPRSPPPAARIDRAAAPPTRTCKTTGLMTRGRRPRLGEQRHVGAPDRRVGGGTARSAA